MTEPHAPGTTPGEPDSPPTTPLPTQPQPTRHLPAAGGHPSPWWAADAPRDPWRDPQSAPAWVAPQPPPPPGPDPRLVVSGQPPTRGVGLGAVFLVALVTALIAGMLGGGLGFVLADRTGGGVSLGESGGSTPELANRPPKSIAGVVQRVQPSVVTVVINAAGGSGNGSGFVISDKGYILTNNHVAAPAAQGGSLRVVFRDGRSATATIVGRDKGSDVAVLKIDGNDLKPLPFGDSDKIAVGDPTIAFGSPLGLADTVTSGIVSAVDRPVQTGGQDSEGEAFMAAIQTDAAINPGNSGGPLVDGAGRVIGINSAIASLPGEGKAGNIGIGFAIPINQAKRIAEQIIATGRAKTTIIGAVLDRTAEVAGGGVRIREVPAGPAKDAGLQPGDVITKFNGRPLNDAVDLIALIRKERAGTKVSIEYRRGGRTATTTITLAEKTV